MVKSNDKLHNVKWLRKPNALNVLARGFSNKTSFTFLRSPNISCAAKRIIFFLEDRRRVMSFLSIEFLFLAKKLA